MIDKAPNNNYTREGTIVGSFIPQTRQGLAFSDYRQIVYGGAFSDISVPPRLSSYVPIGGSYVLVAKHLFLIDDRSSAQLNLLIEGLLFFARSDSGYNIIKDYLPENCTHFFLATEEEAKILMGNILPKTIEDFTNELTNEIHE